MSNLKFNNLQGRKAELEAAGVYTNHMSEAELVHVYDLQFLANTTVYATQSRQYQPPGVRQSKGPYKGHFPPARKTNS